MKKNLAKKIVLGLLTGAVLMSSSVVWAAGFRAVDENKDTGASRALGEWSVTVGWDNAADGVGSIAIGHNSFATGNNSIVIGSNGSGMNSDDGDKGGNVGYDNCIVIGSNSNAGRGNSVALGNGSKVYGTGSVALGYGSYVGSNVENVVSVGSGGSQYITAENAPATRKIINVTKGEISETSNEVVVGSQLFETNKNVEGIDKKIGDMGDFALTNYLKDSSNLVGAVSTLDAQVKDNNDIIGSGKLGYRYANYISGKDLTEAAKELDGRVKANADAIANKANASDVYTKAQADSTFVKISTNANDAPTSGFNVVNTNDITKVSVTHVGGDNPVVISSDDGITVGEHSTRMDGSGFYVWAKNDTSNHNPDKAIASIKDDGSIKAAAGKFKVDADGNVTAEKVTAKEVVAENLYTKDDIDGMLGGSNASISGINQRLDKTNAKINKVGAGAAALAALHPLEYDPDDKLTFSAGMGNYAGENAAALGAFYRPNEKFMVSLGGTMGNGENMVNLGLSIGLDKPNGYAKLSKRELIQKVNAMEAKYEAVEAEKEAMKAEMAEMKAMLQVILAKK